jgi:hypothetical protein
MVAAGTEGSKIWTFGPKSGVFDVGRVVGGVLGGVLGGVAAGNARSPRRSRAGNDLGLNLDRERPSSLEIPSPYPDIWDRNFSVGTQKGVSIPLTGYRKAIALARPGTGNLSRMRPAESPKEHSHMGILTLQIFATSALLVGHLFVVVRNRLTR